MIHLMYYIYVCISSSYLSLVKNADIRIKRYTCFYIDYILSFSHFRNSGLKNQNQVITASKNIGRHIAYWKNPTEKTRL